MILLEAKSLTVGYKGRHKDSERILVENLDFSIFEGDSIAIYGASGTGKSTLIKVLAGLLIPLHGTVFFRNYNLGSISNRTRANLLNRNIGFVYQSCNLLADFTVFENIFFPAKLKLSGDSTRLKATKEEIEHLLHIFKMAHRRDAMPHELSGGEEHRVALLRAIINKPDILFCDEPTASLDHEAKELVIDMLRCLKKQYQTAIIIVTHDRDFTEVVDQNYFLASRSLRLLFK